MTDTERYVKKLDTMTSIFRQITRPQIGVFGEKHLDGYNFSLGWSLLTEPLLMVDETHSHDFDQLIMFWGGDPNNIGELDGEVEIYLGENQDKHVITSPASVFIPKGLMHCPLNIKTVNKPFMFIDITFSPGTSVRPIPEVTR